MNELITPWLEFGEPWRDKWLRALRIELEQGPATIDVAFATDFQTSFEETVEDAETPSVVWTEFTAGVTDISSVPVWHESSHPDVSHWSAPGNYVIELPETVHFEKLKIRLRGVGMKVMSVGLGYMYERT